MPRLDISASIVVTPDLIFLDEPTTGLDPRSRNQVWDIVRALVEQGTTVLLTTQYLEEADQLADRISIIDHGRVIAEGTSAELKASVGSASLHVRLVDPADRPEARAVLERSLDTEVQLESDRSRLTTRVDESARIGAAMTEMSDAGIGVAEFVLGQPTMDEVFFALTGRPATEHDTVPEEAA